MGGVQNVMKSVINYNETDYEFSCPDYHNLLFYVDEVDNGMTIELSWQDGGRSIGSFTPTVEQIENGTTLNNDIVTVSFQLIRKVSMSLLEQVNYCSNDTLDFINPEINSDKNHGSIIADLSISIVDDQNSCVYSQEVTRLDPVVSEESRDQIPIEQLYPNKIDLNTLLQTCPDFVGKELEISLSNSFFNSYGFYSYRELYVLEPPPPLTVAPPNILCSGGSVESLTINGFPDNETDASLRIDIVKLVPNTSSPGATPDTIISGVEYYWTDQVTALIADKEINPGNNSITLDAESVTGDNFEIDEGVYGIKVFYYDGGSSLCPSTTYFVVHDPEPLGLSLELETYSTSSGTEYEIPVNGEKITLDGSVTNNQGASSLYFKKEGTTGADSTSFSFGSTEFETGTYTFWATDDYCKSNEIVEVLNQPSAISVTDNKYNPVCNENNTANATKKTGSISIKVDSGGIPNFYAECINDATDESLVIEEFGRSVDTVFTELDPGTYTLKIWDNGDPQREEGGAVFSENYTISAPDKMTMTASPTDVSCHGGADGTIDLSVTNGTSSFSYTSTGGNSGSFSGTSSHTIDSLQYGDYEITVTDANECKFTSDKETINQPTTVLSITKTGSSPATCESSDGSLTFEVSGGWSHEKYLVTLKGSKIQGTKEKPIEAGAEDKTVTFENLPAGTDYKVTVTNDGECSTTPDETFTVAKNNPLQEALSLSLSKKESCVNKKDAKIFVKEWENIQGDFSYSVTGNSDINYSSGYISGLTSTMGATVDTVKIHETDEEGRKCSFTDTVNITVIDNPVAFSSDSIVPASCSTASNGSISVKGEGGIGELGYKLDDGEYDVDTVFKNKAPGAYTVSIKDDAGCIVDKEFEVDAAPNPIRIEQIVREKASCQTSHDGEIVLENITHDKGLGLTLTYKLGDVNITSGDNFPYANLEPKEYNFSIRDDNNCSIDTTITLLHNNYSPHFTHSIIEEVACSVKKNGRVLFKTNNDEDIYSYELYSEADLEGELVDKDTVEQSTDSFMIEGLGYNPNYSIKITDGKKCFGSIDSFEMPITDNSLEISLTPSPASCVEVANGELYISAAGGFPFEHGEYRFFYEKNTDRTVEEQANNWTVKNLAVGDYLNVSVEDKYGCSISDARTIEIKNDPTQILGFETTNPACNGAFSGSIDLDMQWTPETGDYNFALFKRDDNLNYIDTISGILDTIQPVIPNLSAGTYDLQVTDSDGCFDLYDGVELLDPDTVSVDIHFNYIRAKGDSTGMFNIDLAGGNEKYEIVWSKLPEEELYANPDTVTEFSYNVLNLSAGDYFIAVRDTANCAYFDGESWFTQEITIVEPELALGIGNDTVFNVSCNKFSDGHIEIDGEGGWGPYLYSLNGGETQNSGIFKDLTAGDYLIELTDTAGVSFSRSYTLTEPDTLNIFLDDFRDATCPLYANGYVEATAINGIDGSFGLQYSIEDLSGGEVIEESFDDRSYGFFNLPKGNYELYVTDDHNCRASKQFTIDEPDTAAINLTYNYIKKKGESTGEILSMVDGGNGVFEYQWYLDDGTEPFESGTTLGEIALESLSAGVYTLMVRDTAGCVYENNEWMVREIDIREPEVALAFEVNKNRAVSCFGLQDGLIEIEPSGGWGDYTYRLDEGNYGADWLFNDLVADEYLISIRDSSGTDYSELVVVTQPEPLEASLQSIDDVLCFGGDDGAIHLSVTGGNLSYLVSVDGEEWQTGTSIHELPIGDYSLHVKDTLGCSLMLESVNLAQPHEIVLVDETINKSVCDNNEGSIIASFEGGIGEFQYAWYEKDTLLERENDASVFDLYSGKYQVIVTDEHNCDVPFEFFVGDISDLAIDTVFTRDVWCWGNNDGEAFARVTDGNPPYNYTWSKNIGNSTDSVATEIPAGEHELMVIDSKNCKEVKTFEVGTPDSLYYSTTTYEHPLCLGGEKGTIEVEGTGGTPGYSYLWSDGTSASYVNDLIPGVYELMLTDSHDCQSEFTFEMDYQRTLHPDVGPDTIICHYDALTLNGGDYNRFKWGNEAGVFASTRTVSIETPGTYYLEVEDIDNCLGFDTLALKQRILEIESLTYSDVTCYNAKDGEAEIAVNTNKNDYSIVWPDGSGSSQWTDLSGGEYSVRIENPLGCFDQQSFTIAEPDPLSLTSSIMNPLCYGVFDGEVNVSPSGGNGAYQYEWDHGAASGSLNGLDQGTYSVLVRDSKNCTISDIFNLSYTRSLMPDLGSDLVLCSNSGGYLSPGSFEDYRWFLDGEQIDTDSTLLVSEPGNYQVEVSDEDNCLAFDTIRVDQTMSDLSPEFLMATSVPKGDTLMLVDVTNPKPTGLEWHFSGNFEIVEEGDYFCEVVFDKEGIQFVTLSALMGECLGQVQKQILVTPASESSDLNQNSGTNSSVFSSLNIYPNPTEGAFSVGVELKEAAPLNLYLVRLETGQIFEQSKMTGLKSYSKSYNLSGTGQYVIFAECRGERLMGKVVVF
jgi:hypothetical protein